MSLLVKEVSLEATTGSAQVTSPQFPLIFLGDGLYWRTDVQYEGTQSNWLSMTPAQGYDDADLRAIANTSKLPPGSYSARIAIHAPLAINTPQYVRVTVRVREPIPATLRTATSAIAFTARESDTSGPGAQKIALRMEGEARPDWTASATTLNGGNWLSLTPASGAGEGEITVSAKLSDLPSGVYAGRVTITSSKATNPTLAIPVTFTVTRQKAIIVSGGIVNAASLKAGPIAPGQLLTIVGDRLGPRNGIAAQSGERFPTSLAGTRVLFDGVPGAMLYAGVNQLNVQAPFEIAGKASVKVSIESAGYDASDAIDVPVAASAAGMFSYNGNRAAALNQDYSLNTPQSPAAPGDIVQFYLTGQGLTTPRVPSGAIAPSAAPFPAPDQEVVILIDGVRAEIVFAGLAPGAVGLLQVNARVPQNTRPGDNVIVGARIGASALPDVLMLAVRPTN